MPEIDENPYPQEGDPTQIVTRGPDLMRLQVVKDLISGKYRNIVDEEIAWQQSLWMLDYFDYDKEKVLLIKRKAQERYDKIWEKVKDKKNALAK